MATELHAEVSPTARAVGLASSRMPAGTRHGVPDDGFEFMAMGTRCQMLLCARSESAAPMDQLSTITLRDDADG